MPALLGRIRRLERVVDTRCQSCPECGRWPGGFDALRHRPMRYTFEPREPASCTTCGQPTVLVLELESPKDVQR